MRGSAIQVGPQQFPEIHACVATFAERLKLPSTPEVYIVESNNLNASAIEMAGKQVVLLNDEVVEACLRQEDPRALAFIIGHELAHHALDHTGMIGADYPPSSNP